MQYGFDIKIKKFNPRILLNSIKDAFLAWIGVSGTQITLNNVPFSNVKTIKKTIGAPGVAGCDFNFVSAANTTQQNIDLGAIIPALARVIDVKLHTEVGFEHSLTTLVAEVGNASSGAQFIADGTILARNAVLAVAHTGSLNVAPSAAASKVYVGVTPGDNWSNMVQGRVAIHITYIEATAVDDDDTTTTTTTTTTPGATTTTTTTPGATTTTTTTTP